MTHIFIFIFLLSTAYGIFHGTRELRGLRATWQHAEAIFRWKERPFESLRHEGLSWIVTLIHWLAVMGVVLATLAHVLNSAPLRVDLVTFLGSRGGFLSAWILATSFSMIAFLWGRTLLTPFGNPFAGPANYELTPEGIVFGGHLFPWRAFSHFTVHERDGVFRLWATASPGIVLFVFGPERPGDWNRLQAELSRFLVSSPPSAQATSRPGWVYPASMVLISALAVVISMLILQSLGTIALVANLFLVFFFMQLGGRWMLRFGYGGYARKLKKDARSTEIPADL